VVRVAWRQQQRVSLAALICIKPGCRPRLIYRVHHGRELAVIRISSGILDLPGALITDGNATSGGTRFDPSPQGSQLAGVTARFVSSPSVRLMAAGSAEVASVTSSLTCLGSNVVMSSWSAAQSASWNGACAISSVTGSGARSRSCSMRGRSRLLQIVAGACPWP
jgi:hypothetical protein